MAALCGKVAIDIELNCSAAKMWDGLMHAHEHYPKILPEKFASMEYIKGDCMAVGSLKMIVFTEVYIKEIPSMKMMVEKIESVDHDNMELTYTLFEGDLLRYFKAFSVTIKIVAKGDGCVVTWSLDYEKVNGEPPSPNVFLEMAKNRFEHLSAHLLKH